jgi:UDP-N-acetylmuramoyl-tripeptide--D-alanyl-D-alanine ligase
VGSFTIIDESYNASPIAVEMAIKVLSRKQLVSQGRRILVLGDMRELGEHAQAMHIALKKAILDSTIEQVFCCGEMMKHLYDALPPHLRAGYAYTSTLLAPMVTNAVATNDFITIKGSKSVGMHRVVQALENLSTTSISQAS